jgi:hypothetical protein
VIDVGVQDELRNVRRSGDDFDMNEVARVMDIPAGLPYLTGFVINEGIAAEAQD